MIGAKEFGHVTNLFEELASRSVVEVELVWRLAAQSSEHLGFERNDPIPAPPDLLTGGDNFMERTLEGKPAFRAEQSQLPPSGLRQAPSV